MSGKRCIFEQATLLHIAGFVTVSAIHIETFCEEKAKLYMYNRSSRDDWSTVWHLPRSVPLKLRPYSTIGIWLHSALSLAVQCIVIGPVCVCLFVCGSVTTITGNCMH